jgi:4-amino-4-deoxy-L-arabinose transferase-like glycosyltransferase
MIRRRPAASRCPVSRARRPPAALVALLFIVAAVGLSWALAVAPWQSPDELSQYAYVESLATSLRLPGNPHREIFSSDETTAINAVDASNGAFYPATVPPDWSRSAYEAYVHNPAALSEASRDNGGGPSSAAGNPPLYYLIGSIGYLLDPGGTAYGRLYAIRIEGIVFLLLTGLGAWLLAGETFGPHRLAQLVTAAVATLLPMSSFISTSVNPDGLIITEWTFALWLAARIVTRAARIQDVAAMCALLAAAILTKDNSYALIPPEALAVAVGLARRPPDMRLRSLSRLAACSLIAIVPVGIWLGVSRSIGGTAISQVGTGGKSFDVRQFLSYVWQFYLPRLPFMRPFHLVGGIPAVTVWVKEGAGNFGWLSMPLPSWMVPLSEVLLGVIAVSAAWLLAKLRGLARLGLLAVDVLALASLLALLHITEYRQWLGTGVAFLQGRYILPVVSLLGLAVGLVIMRLPRSTRPPAAALTLIGLLAGQAFSLATVLHGYYL